MDRNIIKRHVVAIDISTEQTTYAVVDLQGGILAKESSLC